MQKIFLLVTALSFLVACGGAPQATPVPAAATVPGQATLVSSGPVVITAAGDIKPKVDEYKALFGQDNGGNPGSQPSGFRTLIWDSVPDELATPNNLPPDFFNDANAPRARGAFLSTPGTGVQVSANPVNASKTPPRFGNINPQYANIFKTFSPERLFSPIGSNAVDLTFFVPGTKTPAVTRGFGAVYTNVRIQKTDFEFFDAGGKSLGKFPVPLAKDGLSFLGVFFSTPLVARVHIAYGTNALGPDDAGDVNVAVMDDFVFGEPQAASQAAAPTSAPAAASSAGFVQLGDSLNRDKSQAASDYKLIVGSLEAGKLGAAWLTWAEKQDKTQQIFVSKQNGNKFEPVGASLNIHSNLVAEGPSIDFAGPDRTVPWVAWYEPSPRAGASPKQVFASRFNAVSGLWIPAGQDRGGNEPSLNIHPEKLAQDPNLVGGTTNPANPPSPWVCWQEVSVHNNAVEIFVSHAVSDTTALGGFKWQPVGLNRSGTDKDPEPSVNVDVTGGSNSDHCQLTFAETNNTVPWVVWAEKLRLAPTQIFVARAVTDNTPGAGGFKWQFVPNCTGAADANKCVLNVNPTKDAFEPSIAAGSTTAGQATVPWLAWSEVGATGKLQIFVDRLDLTSRNTFLNVGGSLNVDQNRDARAPDITFIGNVPFVAWDEEVGNSRRVFVRHLASDPQTGTWVLDTPKEGLAIDKTKNATGPDIRATPDGKIVIAFVQGDPAKEASQLLVCTNAKLTSLLLRVPGLAAPLFQAKACQ